MISQQRLESRIRAAAGQDPRLRTRQPGARAERPPSQGPVSVFGTVLMRDDLDFKCIYLFQRDRENWQVISSPIGQAVLIIEDRPLVTVFLLEELSIMEKQNAINCVPFNC